MQNQCLTVQVDADYFIINAALYFQLGKTQCRTEEEQRENFHATKLMIPCINPKHPVEKTTGCNLSVCMAFLLLPWKEILTNTRSGLPAIRQAVRLFKGSYCQIAD